MDMMGLMRSYSQFDDSVNEKEEKEIAPDFTNDSGYIENFDYGEESSQG